MPLIEALHEIELGTLLTRVHVLVADVLDQLLDLLMLGVDVGALERAWEKSRLPVLGLLNGVASRAAPETRQAQQRMLEASQYHKPFSPTGLKSQTTW